MLQLVPIFLGRDAGIWSVVPIAIGIGVLSCTKMTNYEWWRNEPATAKGFILNDLSLLHFIFCILHLINVHR